MADVFDIAGRINSTSNEHVVTTADQIKDEDKNKKQSQINAETISELATHESRLNAYTEGKFVTVDTYSGLPATGVVDTVYRVSSWDGTANSGQGAVDVTKYSEYAWENGAYKFLDVKTQIGEVFDISEYNNDTYIDLADALSDTNVPQDVRRGGMSVKYVCSSDNMYTQYRYMLDDATDVSDFTNTDNWSFCGDDVLVENPEFVEVHTDAEGKVLWAIKADGSIFWGAGVPQQVVDYIQEKIDELSLDEYEDIVTFLGSLIEGDKTLAQLLEEKVDKEENKSLIPDQYIQEVENSEFVEVVTDNEKKITDGTRVDGTKFFPGGVETPKIKTGGTVLEAVDNPEWMEVTTDSQGRILHGTREDGSNYAYELKSESIDRLQDDVDSLNETKVEKEEGKSLVQSDIAQSVRFVDNPEFLEVETDNNGRIIAGRKLDGSKFENLPVENPAAIISGIEDPEGRHEITLDKDKRIISYRDGEGRLHEEAGVETSSLHLTDDGMTEFQQALKDNGFVSGQGDWSDSKELHIAEPYCAFVNFSGINNIPQQKYDDEHRPHAYMQFWDMQGNYFKKEVLINAQGRSTLQHPKKGIAIDICNNNGWDDGDTFSLQIGDWVVQDSFHLKAFYNDPFRCLSPVAYKLYDEVLKSRGEFNDYVWKRALLDLSSVTATSTGCVDAEEAIEGWNTNARCFPMGFPCIVYLNGEYYGIYSWQLKKHRDNYKMSKKKTKHVHLDGIISTDRILNANGDTTQIWWTSNDPEGIEIRNPKPKKKKDGWDLVLLDGTKYDADVNGGELMSPTMVVEGQEVANPNWDSTDESHTKSYEVKQYILNMSKIYPSIEAAWAVYDASSKTAADKETFKAVYEAHLDVDNLIDYLIFSDVLANYDGFSQNVQWVTYDGSKWYLCAYDLDGVMGNWWELNDTIVSPRTTHYNSHIFAHLPAIYGTELEARYKELRDLNIISVDNIVGLVESWLKRIGAKNTFEKEWTKWSGFIKNDNIHRLYKWVQTSISNMDTLYNYNN